MLRLVIPVSDTMEKARPGLVYRIDLPYKMPNGTIGYRRGWVKPEDAKALDRAKKKGDPGSAVGIRAEADLFDDAAGEAWAPQEGRAPKPDAKAAENQEPKPVPVVASTVAERIPQPEAPETSGEEGGRGGPLADLAQPIAKMQFRDYGSWSAKGKHLSAEKRAKLNQDIAELLNDPADTLDEGEMAMIRQYSGFGGVKASGERGVLYDYFTSPPVARMVWKLANAVMPLKEGARVLEPSCGTGVFFDVAPQGVDLTGVEYDARTSAVAGLLQPQARVYHSSFEQFNLHQREKFDSVIGNAPFGDRSIATSFLDEPEEKSLDRYFISRSLDNLKGGGTMALIVAPGVMDNATNKEWRSAMLRKGQFIGAMRLPNQSFKHTHTGVSPDVVMFRAYPEDVRRRLDVMSNDEMRALGLYDDAWVNGTYYDEKPAHRLGRVEQGQFGSEVTVGKLEPADIDRALQGFEPRATFTKDTLDAVRAHGADRQTLGAEAPDKLSEAEAAAVAAKTLRVGMTKTQDGKVYRLNANHRWELVQGADGGVAAKLDRLKEISETVRAIREAMRADEPADDLQRQARSLIEAYARDYGVGHFDDPDIQKFIKANPSVAGVYEGLTVRVDSDLLTKQNVYDKEIDIVDGHRPAIRALMELQRDLTDATPATLKARYPQEADALVEAMWSDPDVFVDEAGTFRLREDFISGNAWEKIDALEKAIQDYPGPEYERNRAKWKEGAEALRDAVGWVPIEDADVFPQASWIPEEIVNRWAENGMNHEAPNGYRYARNEEGKWGIVAKEDSEEWDWKKRRHVVTEAGGWREHNDELVYFLNNQKQRSKFTDTATYNENALESFKAWLATDEEARGEIETLYNRKFNTELGVPTKTYAVHLDGWSDEIEIKPWQWQSIHHLYRQGKGISALGTGFGKTYSAIALYALLRQEGKVKRPMFQVPNNKVKDWVKYFAKAMPGLKVGSVDQDRKGYGNRDTRYQWYQELASGDYDVIILPEACSSEIQLNAENDQMIVDSIASQITQGKGKTDRKQEKAKASAEGKLSGGKKNTTITFEDFGCDAIFCDECFPYGAMVKTDKGDVPIGEIVEKSLDIQVLSCDTSTGRLEYKRVIRKIPRKLNHKVLKINHEGGFLVCTDSHKIWTVENGYQRADAIRAGSTLQMLESEAAGSGREELRMVRDGIQLQVIGENEQRQAPILWRIVRGLLSKFSSACFGGQTRKDAQGWAVDGWKKGAQAFRAHEEKQPYEQPGDERKSAPSFAGPDVSFAGRKRTAYNSTSHAVRSPRPSNGAPHSNPSGQRDVFVASDLLQSGPCDTRIENRNRGGRKVARQQKVEILGCQENGNLASVRVESIEILERGDFERFGFRDSGDCTVYDIEVEGNHNFFADGILVSNCHNYKNLFTSSLSRETGMNDGRRSDRALSFFKKCEYMRRGHDGKNVFALTATPLTNSPLEYYNMMQHIAPEELKRLNVANIDDFIHNFADIEEGQKFDPFSGKPKQGKVLVGFRNLRSLQDMFFKYTDLQNDPSKIGLKKPTPTNRPNIMPMQEDQVGIIRQLAAEVEAYKKMSKEERAGMSDNFLTFYSRMRTASLDLELYDPEKYKGWVNPKIERMADSAMETYQARGGGQVVFCDRVVSGDGSFNMHDKIKNSLIARGFKEEEIVVVNGLTKSGAMASEQAKEREVSSAIDGFNSGKYKVIIGTTQTIGEGVNLQKNSSALHHLDIPYRPSDFIQRNGRVDRQGNKQSNVELHTYAASGTIDNYSMALVSGKENWINQLLKTKSNVFTNPNGDGMDMDEILLSLTEEWGNKDDAEARRGAIATQRAEAVKAENTKKAHDFMRQLSLMRGALSTFKGDKGSRDYQNRLRKIDNIEAALANNPEFRHPEVLTDNQPPFIYDEDARRVVKVGDLVVKGSKVMKVSGFDYKNRQYNLVSVISGEPMFSKNAYASSQGSPNWQQDRKEIFVSSPSKADIERYVSMVKPDNFYQMPEDFRRENYDDFMDMHDTGYSRDSNVRPIVVNKDGKVAMQAWRTDGDRRLNPYLPEDRKIIAEALKAGKMEPSHYEEITELHGPMGAEDSLREAKIKAFRESDDMAPEIEKHLTGGGEVNLGALGGKLKISDYDISSIVKKHPDFTVELKRSPRGQYTYFAIPKREMAKSIGYGKLVADEGGRVYVLQQRGR